MWPKKSFYLFTFALFAVLFGSCIITSKNVSASSFTTTITTTTDSLSSMTNCGSAPNVYSLTSLGFDWSFLPTNVTISFPSSLDLYNVAPGSVWFSNGFADNTCFQGSSFLQTSLKFDFRSYRDYSPPLSSSSSFSLPSIDSNHRLFIGVRYNSDPIVLTLTFSDSSGSECPICPEIPDNPYDDKLDEIRNAIILVPAVCLLLYFFYIIFGIIIPTTGGKK